MTLTEWPLLPLMVDVQHEAHAVAAAQLGRKLADDLGYCLVDATAITTAIMEVASNIVKYGQGGSVELCVSIDDHGAPLLTIRARDRGPGLGDLTLALTDGYSSGASLGVGLPGAARLMDYVDIVSQPGVGTLITLKKYRSTRHP